MVYDLDRFVVIQKRNYATALLELRAGKKVSHWIWYIFPQLKGLGYSENAKHFGLANRDEAQAYIDHPILGPRYLECANALLAHSEQPIGKIMGSAVDVKKLCSSLTLMSAVGAGPTVQIVLDTFFDGERCSMTEYLLAKS